MSGPGPAYAAQDPGADRTSPSALGDLLTGVLGDMSTLVRQEVDLAKAELTESAKKAGKGAGLFGGAAVAGLFALLFLSITAWWALGYLLGNAWSALIVTAVYAIVALILFLRARAQLATIRGLPRTVETVKEIPDTLKPGRH